MGTFNFKSAGKIASQIQLEAAAIAATPGPIGIRTPLRLGDKSLFTMHYDIANQVHDNLRNLLLTNWGERVGFYYFGANLRELTTELSSLDAFDAEAINRIRTAVSTWMPFVNLKDFVSKIDNEKNQNTGIVRIAITYSVSQLQIENRSLQISLYVI